MCEASDAIQMMEQPMENRRLAVIIQLLCQNPAPADPAVNGYLIFLAKESNTALKKALR